MVELSPLIYLKHVFMFEKCNILNLRKIWLLVFSFAIVFLTACDKSSNPPIAILQIYPPKGDSTTLFELNAKGSSDDVSLDPTLEFRWDFDNNGIWDTDFGPNAITVRYFPVPSSYQITVQVKDQDGLISIATNSIVVFGQNKDVSNFTDPRDGQTYQIVRIGERWWMAECLRYGKTIDHWTQPQSDNGIAEHYLLWSSLNQKEYCAYSWHEAMNHNLNELQGICPDGWHLPTKIEWESLYEGMPIFYASEYYNKNGLSGLNLDDGKRFYIDRKDQTENEDFEVAAYWSSHNFFTDYDLLLVSYGSFTHYSINLSLEMEIYLDFSDEVQLVHTVRCIKD